MDLLAINPGLIFWTIVTFVILLLILKQFVWGPIIEAVDRRESSLQAMYDKAEKAKSEADEMLAQYQQKLDEARTEVNKMIEDGKVQATKTADDITAKARSEAEQVIERAKNEIDAQRKLAVDEIKSQAVNLSLQAAERLIRKELDDADHRKLVEQAIYEIDESKK